MSESNLKAGPVSAVTDPEIKAAIDRILAEYFGESAEYVIPYLQYIEWDKNEVLIRQNDIGNEMYILITGALDVFLENDGQVKQIGSIDIGESVGEMALLEDDIRSATVVARRRSRLLAINRDRLFSGDQVSAHLQAKITNIIIRRLKIRNRFESTRTIRSKYIAIYPLDEEVNPELFARSFVEYWKDHKKIALIDKQNAEKLKDHALESNDYNLILCTGTEPENRHMMEEADKVVFLATGGTHLLPHLPENINDRDELVLLFSGDKPAGISSWFHWFKPHKIFRQQLDNVEHRDRIVRIISESAICLVFGGGGAHGLANLGVVKALLDHNVPIDIIGGSSVGSIFASGLAMDWPYDEFQEKIKDSLSRNNPLNDYTFPFVALLRGKKMNRMLKRHFEMPMEELWKNVFMVAANLSSSSTELMETGPLDRSIAASISIPGILPPVLHNQGLLVDGGVLNNLPSDLMATLYRGHIISVDVVSPIVRKLEHSYSVSNTQYLKNLLTGKRKNYIPGTMNTIMKSITLGSIEQAPEKARQSTLYINPRSKKGFLDWKALPVFEKDGYETTVRILSESDYHTLFDLPD